MVITDLPTVALQYLLPFQLHGLEEDILTEQQNQFTIKVWYGHKHHGDMRPV